MTDQQDIEGAKVQADHNSVAVGSVTIGGSIDGSLLIGSHNVVGFTSNQVSALVTQISTTFQPKPFDGRCPYKGLDCFDEEDTELFFGREKWVENLVGRVQESRTLFVTGPSGSGKSSLVRAGLLPALKRGAVQNLRSEHWCYETMKPGRDPFAELARVTSSLAGTLNAGEDIRAKGLTDKTILAQWCEVALKEGRTRRAVIFIDQFEEVFTQIGQEEMRKAFLDLLTHAALLEDGRTVLLFSMRSDFIPNCATYPELNTLLNQQFLQVGAMQPEELVSAIAQPAMRVGLRIDPDLIAQIINDMEGEPGSLPLMQFALQDLFHSRQTQDGVIALTRADYLQRGGIQKSLERHADTAFSELNGQEQELARTIFNGLVAVGRGTLETRRTALASELIPAGTQRSDVNAVVQKLASARLITTDAVTVTISHEKLIDAWPWLKKLVNENRDLIALQNEIAEDARQWKEHARDASYLYSGGRLANTVEKLQDKKLILSGLSKNFVEAGTRIEASRRREVEKRRQKELDDARRLAETAQARARAERRGRLVGRGFLIAALILVVTLSYDPIRRAGLRQRAMTDATVSIPAGRYELGDPTQYDPANPEWFLPFQLYEVPAFAIDTAPVTNERYGYCIQAGICSRPNAPRSEYENEGNALKPVVNISAIDAAEFCTWLGMRLPSDKEWELAVRHKLLKSESGIWEWTRSPYSGNAPEWLSLAQDPPEALVQKGGTENLEENLTFRQNAPSTQSDKTTGFRCTGNGK